MKKDWKWSLLAASALFLTRLPLCVSWGEGRLFNVDELEMTYSTLDRFLGVPPTNLAWPGSVLQFLGAPLIGAAYLLQAGFEVSPTSFLAFLSELYANPWSAVLGMRLLVAVVFSLGTVSLVGPLLRLSGNPGLALTGVFAAATTPLLWQYSAQAMGEGAGAALAFAACGVGLCGEAGEKRFAGCGALAGAAVAGKATFFPLLAFVFGILWDRRRGGSAKLALAFLTGAGLAFLFICPYVWTDPMRLAKSMLGNILRPGEPLGAVGAVSFAFVNLTPWVGLLGLAGFGLLAARGRWGTVAGGLFCLVAALLSASRAGVVAPRYLAPLAVVFVVAGITGVTEVYSGEREKIAVVALVAVTLASTVTAALRLPGRAVDGAGQALSAHLSSLEIEQTLIVPWYLYPYVASKSSSESLIRQSRMTGEAMFSPGKNTVSEQRVQELIGAMPSAFNEDEQAFSARLRAAAGEARAGFRVLFWGNPEYAQRFALLDYDEAVAAFLAEGSALLVTEKPLAGQNPESVFGGHLFCYRRAKP